MKALVLTAGLGRRMQPLTTDRHKTLLEIAPGQTILGRILSDLRVHGVTDVVIVTGYRREEVEKYSRDNFDDLAFTFVHNSRFDETNNIHSMALAFDAVDFDDGLILIESDLIYDDRAIAALTNCPHDDVALLDNYRPGMDGTVVKMDRANRIINVIPGSQQGDDFDFSQTYKTLNIYRFSAHFCSSTFSPLLKFYSAAIDDNCYYELILGMLISMGHANVHGALVPSGSWAEVDDPVDLHHARFMSDPHSRRRLLDHSWGGYWGLEITDFAFIRNMHYPTPQVLTELKMQLPELVFNYGSSQRILDQKIAWFARVPSETIVALNGASQFFPWASRHFSGRHVLVPHPTFGEWLRTFPTAEHYEDLGDGHVAIPAQVPPDAVLVVVNPNNPTGSTVDTDEIERFCLDRPDVTVLVDESFIHFSAYPSLVDSIPDRKLHNLVVLQSLSKALGVPGLRIGFACSSDEEIIDGLRSSLPIWNMNSLAEKFIELLLKNRDALDLSFVQTIQDRDDLMRQLATLEIVGSVSPSGANFVLARLSMTPEESNRLADRIMESDGMYVKDVSAKFLDGSARWRLAVRTPHDHLALVQRVRAAVTSELTMSTDGQ